MDHARGEHMESAAILMSALERFSAYDLTIVDEKLRGALVGAANYRQQAG